MMRDMCNEAALEEFCELDPAKLLSSWIADLQEYDLVWSNTFSESELDSINFTLNLSTFIHTPTSQRRASESVANLPTSASTNSLNLHASQGAVGVGKTVPLPLTPSLSAPLLESPRQHSPRGQSGTSPARPSVLNASIGSSSDSISSTSSTTSTPHSSAPPSPAGSIHLNSNAAGGTSAPPSFIDKLMPSTTSTAKNPGCIIGIYENVLPWLYRTFTRMRSFLIKNEMRCTHVELLNHIQPLLGFYYEQIVNMDITPRDR